MGNALDAVVATPDEVTPAMLAEADRVGVGSGIYWMSFDPRLIEWDLAAAQRFAAHLAS